MTEKITVAHGPHGLHQVRDAREALRGKVEVLTAGDEKVCRQCQDISEEGPYTLAEAHDLIPAHPNCRCAFIPAHDLRYASVHEDSATGAGAGILFMTPDGRGLFMRRCKGDHPGEWAFPAGGIEGNETASTTRSWARASSERFWTKEYNWAVSPDFRFLPM